ncbi:hypothetical protein [Mycoplasma crocodyli]|uniref:hypothetical protein n=1 Tax=Mycoplasma crocodyli TaxID=50052 RepID=UPI0002DCC315|nr:hypothetical protein [Mycoplasma crocodyli]
MSSYLYSESQTYKFSFTKPSAINIGLWVMGSILILVLFCVILWRLFHSKIHKNTNNKEHAGSISKEFIDFMSDLSKSEKIDLLINIPFKNKYSKNNISLIPALIRYQNKLFLVSDLVINKGSDEIIIQNSETYLKRKNKIKKINNFENYWFKEILKFLEKEIDAKFEVKKVLFLKNELNEHKSFLDYLVTTQQDLINDFKKENIKEISDYDFIKIKQKLISWNLNPSRSDNGTI